MTATRAALAAILLAALVPLAATAAGSPRPGVYIGAMVNEDTVTVHVSADGKTGTATVGCLDLGETLTFDRFAIVRGAFRSTMLSATVPRKPVAKLSGKFTSPTTIAAFVNEHPSSVEVRLGGGAGIACYGISSPATLTLKPPRAH